MGIYVFNYLCIALYAFMNKNLKMRNDIFFILIFLQIALTMIIRSDDIIIDYPHYYLGFEQAQNLTFSDILKKSHLFSVFELQWPCSLESGYVIFNWIIAKLGGNFRTMVFVCDLFCLFSFFLFIKKYSKMKYLSLAMFLVFGFYEYAFGVLRQSIALAVLLFSIYYIEKRDFKFFLGFVLLAFTFHRASIVFIPLYWFYGATITRKTFIMTSVLLISLTLISPFIFSYFALIFMKFLLLLGKSEIAGALSVKYNNLIVLMFLLLIPIFLFVDFNKFSTNKIFNVLGWSYFYSILVEMFGLFHDTIARAVEIPFIFSIIYIPNIIVDYKDKNMQILGILIFYILLLFFYIYKLDSSTIVPYRSIL